MTDLERKPAQVQGVTLPTPNAVAHRLIELGRLLDEATEEIGVLDERFVEAKQEHEIAYSRCLLVSKESSADRRKADAVLQCADLKLHMEIAEQLVRAAKERIKTLRDQMEIARSVGAATRAEWAATSWTQP